MSSSCATAPRPRLVSDRAGVASFDAPEDTIVRAFLWLAQRRTDMPGGTFLFVLSDFVAELPIDAWMDAIGHGWDVVPVVIQDPVWERSWPKIGGVGVPVSDPRGGQVELVRMSRRQAERRRGEHEAR